MGVSSISEISRMSGALSALEEPKQVQASAVVSELVPDVAHPIASKNPLVRFFFVASGWLSLTLGFFGIFLPLLPTTPFVLLAALCFSKGSPRLHNWLRSTKLAGRIIRDWEEHGMIRHRTKVVTTVLMVGLTSYPVIFIPMWMICRVLMICTSICVLTFIWTRPSEPNQRPARRLR